MMCTEAETFLMLKYGSIAAAYHAWTNMSFRQAEEEFDAAGYDLIIKYELRKWRENRNE